VSATLLFIYGPPAVGKLTLAEAVARRTGFKLLHNHAVIDAVTPLFEFGTAGFFELVGTFRQALYSAAAREGVNVITTYGSRPTTLSGSWDTSRAFGSTEERFSSCSSSPSGRP
jgi:hypothetical protein